MVEVADWNCWLAGPPLHKPVVGTQIDGYMTIVIDDYRSSGTSTPAAVAGNTSITQLCSMGGVVRGALAYIATSHQNTDE